MPIKLPLETMSVAEKLQLLEMVWASLCKEPTQFISPDCHEEMLNERRRRLTSGEATVSKWSHAKQRLQNLGR